MCLRVPPTGSSAKCGGGGGGGGGGGAIIFVFSDLRAWEKAYEFVIEEYKGLLSLVRYEFLPLEAKARGR